MGTAATLFYCSRKPNPDLYSRPTEAHTNQSKGKNKEFQETTSALFFSHKSTSLQVIKEEHSFEQLESKPFKADNIEKMMFSTMRNMHTLLRGSRKIELPLL